MQPLVRAPIRTSAWNRVYRESHWDINFAANMACHFLSTDPLPLTGQATSTAPRAPVDGARRGSSLPAEPSLRTNLAWSPVVTCCVSNASGTVLSTYLLCIPPTPSLLRYSHTVYSDAFFLFLSFLLAAPTIVSALAVS